MIPTAEKTVQVQSNIPASATGQFTVDESALGHIMDVLTNLYSDPEGAVTREYMTNAYDSQVEAGQKPGTPSWKPIQVTTPSHFNKSYKIRDFGLGMSSQDLIETYSKYGKSTKTTSNDVVGMLGLGSKCALTYTGSFTITGWKDGIKTMAIISKNDENIPVFHIVDTSASDEPNGVEINVPVKDRNSFAEKTEAFLQWWAPGLVEVNGKAPKHHGLTKVQDSKVLYKVSGAEVSGTAEVFLVEGQKNIYSYRGTTPQSRVVMGNVAYDVSEEYVSDDLTNVGMGFVAYVPMGAVSFPPSREKLMFNAGTKDVISQLSKGLFESIIKTKKDAITACTDKREAWNTYRATPAPFTRHASFKGFTWKGLDPSMERIQHPHMDLDWDWKGNGQISERTYVSLPNAMTGTLIVTGVEQGTKPTSYFKKKVKYYMEQNNIDGEGALLVKDDITEAWLDWLPRIDADTIKAIKLPKNPSVAGPRAEATYEVWNKDAHGTINQVDVTTITATGRLAYISPSDMRETYRHAGTTTRALMESLPADVHVVVLAANRNEKFLRTYPTAKHLRVIWQEEINTLAAKVTANEFIVENLDYYENQFLSKVDAAKIDDPDLADLARIVQGTNGADHYKQAQNMEMLGRRARMNTNVPAQTAKAGTNPTKRYPLIEHVGARKIDHLLIYINTVYATQHKPKP